METANLVMKMAELSQRRGAILKVVVAEYIATGVPVASEAVARGYSLGIGPATIRNEMAYLEEQGYMGRPHPSAGGVPSDRGYRYYVGCLMSEEKISQRERRAIQQFFSQVEREPDEWARLAVSVLTQRVRSIAIATPPRATVCHFRRLELISLQELMVMLVLVLQEGRMKQRLIGLEQTASQGELVVMANKLNEAYRSRDHIGIHNRAVELHLSPIEERVTDVIVEVMKTEDNEGYERCYLDGWRYLVGNAGVIGSRRMLDLVEALEERSVLNRLLSASGDSEGIRITIGGENAELALQECSVILSNYGAGGSRGTIGVIGPTRMPYNRAIPMVEYVSAVMSELVGSVYA
jgi:heat-inducible transcriptional repressor